MSINIKIERCGDKYVGKLDGKAVTKEGDKTEVRAGIQIYIESCHSNKGLDSYLEADTDKNGLTTVKELKVKLDKMKIDYGKKAKKQELVKLLGEK